jgi:hypothetical protein
LFGRYYRFAALELDAGFPPYILANKAKYAHLINENKALNPAQLFWYQKWCIVVKYLRKWQVKIKTGLNIRCMFKKR